MAATDTSSQPGRAPVQVGLIGTASSARATLCEGLVQHGLAVMAQSDLVSVATEPLQGDVQVLLVDLNGASDADLDALDQLMERDDLPPVLFNEDAPEQHQAVWMRRLAGKLRAMAGAVSDGEAAPAGPPVWVLGSSFGGPEAVKRFLETVTHVPEAVFILVQHIGDGFVDLLAAQLNRSTPFRVESLANGIVLRPGRVYVMPVDHVLHLTDADEARLVPEVGADHSYSPNIDAVLTAVARTYGPRSGAIIFSGMGDDGAAGVRAIAASGGEVWAQDAGSCAISNMPDCAAATGVVTRRGNPEELAGALVQYLRSEDAPPNAV
ncbi:chemotaxis protein CheB [Aquisalimonas asiatica]|uniref:protein-glutamate methylesterase n=1 Tax=Aquisalimonas asiatica TaxID=406100 RepID=A0A1H8TQE1_9GAMM|nr:chemotaxis protein CheB [Aquisalimonas asiatica]SEO93085.1 CheB methylesterase [Aquisalimonas asiatica]